MPNIEVSNKTRQSSISEKVFTGRNLVLQKRNIWRCTLLFHSYSEIGEVSCLVRQS